MKDLVPKVLSNGIRVYLYPDPDMKKVIASYNISYGSRGYYDKFYFKKVEYQMPPAMAHFLEHTLIEKSKYGNMLHRFKDKNYEVNGLTYPELTTYYFVGMNDWKESLKELIHMVDDPVFNEDDIEDVKGAIVDEVLKNDDNKYSLAFNLNRRNTFKNFEDVSESLNTLGSKETTESITYLDAKICYDAYYHDGNKFLIIGGNFAEEEIISLLENIYSEIKPHKCELQEYDYREDFDVRCEYEEIKKPVNEDITIITIKIKNDFKESNLLVNYYLEIFKSLKFSSDTEFIEKLNKEKIIAGGIGGIFDFFKDTISLIFNAETPDSDKFIELFLDELKTKNFDEARFNLLKKSFKASSLNKLEFKYRYLINKANTLDYFSDKLFNFEVIDSLNFKDFEKFVERLDFSIKTITVIRK